MAQCTQALYAVVSRYKFLTDNRFRSADWCCGFQLLPALADAYNAAINGDRLGLDANLYPTAFVTAICNLISECVKYEGSEIYCPDGVGEDIIGSIV
ncbi:hypothetical protein KC315_g2420 [Hortaea werneckii]|nr:hypothetical protein KC315_g2420 [Hortaea werneckii]